eukprot:TRINITY_DN24638_c0_g1_i1.p1 TRINITY_DN24638_c0_g1~~TRINITY_DN24638_c0_g1_i1.p1  ORF type:complete len:302 (+),score=59.20 TRINITY_DN24638_c0_g1_i1:55-960(+)
MMRLDVPMSTEGEVDDGPAEYHEEEVEEELFRVGASSDVMAALQQHEDAYCCAQQTKEPLSEGLKRFAMHSLYHLVSHLPGCFLELLHAFHLSLSILSELDAALVTRGPAGTNSELLREEVIRTCMAIVNLSLKQACSETLKETEDRLQQWMAWQGGDLSAWRYPAARVLEREKELFATLRWPTLCAPTAAVWMRIFQTRLNALRGNDALVQKLCGESCQSLLKVQPEEIMASPPRQLAAGILAKTARSLGLEQELVDSFELVTGTDIGSCMSVSQRSPSALEHGVEEVQSRSQSDLSLEL